MITNTAEKTRITAIIEAAKPRKKHTTGFKRSDAGHGAIKSTFVYGTGFSIMTNGTDWTGYYANGVLQHEEHAA